MLSENGYLKISVSEAGGTIPIKGASVIISEYPETNGAGGTVLYSLTTNESGLTETVSLQAPQKSESMIPGSYRPYSLYNIDVIFDGYYPIESVGVPVFAGVTSLQSFNLLPLSEKENIEGEENGRIMIYETPSNGSLTPSGTTRDEISHNNGTVSGGVIREERT